MFGAPVALRPGEPDHLAVALEWGYPLVQWEVMAKALHAVTGSVVLYSGSSRFSTIVYPWRDYQRHVAESRSRARALLRVTRDHDVEQVWENKAGALYLARDIGECRRRNPVLFCPLCRGLLHRTEEGGGYFKRRRGLCVSCSVRVNEGVDHWRKAFAKSKSEVRAWELRLLASIAKSAANGDEVSVGIGNKVLEVVHG